MFKTLYHSIKKKWVSFILLMMISFMGFAGNTEPTLNNGHKWRIAYYEGGPFINYHKGLYWTVISLMDLGWIEKKSISLPEGDDAEPLWLLLSTQIKSDYIEFPKDAFYSSKWNDLIRLKTSASLLNRINNKKDIDLLLAAGTQAGQDFVTEKNRIPTFVLTSSNPIAAGIIFRS